MLWYILAIANPEIRYGDHIEKQRIAEFLRRNVWAAWLSTQIIRMTRARYSAGVVAVVVNENHGVLLVEHVFHAVHPWGLPGGWLDSGEEPEAALRRELMEELGLSAEVIRPVSVRTGEHYRHLDIAFLCRATGEIGDLSMELLSAEWVQYGELPAMMPFHRHAIDAVFSQEISR